jgi:hypothetical protein
MIDITLTTYTLLETREERNKKREKEVNKQIYKQIIKQNRKNCTYIVHKDNRTISRDNNTDEKQHFLKHVTVKLPLQYKVLDGLGSYQSVESFKIFRYLCCSEVLLLHRYHSFLYKIKLSQRERKCNFFRGMLDLQFNGNCWILKVTYEDKWSRPFASSNNFYVLQRGVSCSGFTFLARS